MTTLLGRHIHPAHRGGILPRQASGLYYHNRFQGFKVAEGAFAKQFETSKGTAWLFINSEFILGMVREAKGTWPRLMTQDELEKSAMWLYRQQCKKAA